MQYRSVQVAVHQRSVRLAVQHRSVHVAVQHRSVHVAVHYQSVQVAVQHRPRHLSSTVKVQYNTDQYRPAAKKSQCTVLLVAQGTEPHCGALGSGQQLQPHCNPAVHRAAGHPPPCTAPGPTVQPSVLSCRSQLVSGQRSLDGVSDHACRQISPQPPQTPHGVIISSNTHPLQDTSSSAIEVAGDGVFRGGHGDAKGFPVNSADPVGAALLAVVLDEDVGAAATPVNPGRDV